MSARVLVTGGAGFIGSHLVEALVQRGHCVRVVDDFSTGRRENLTSVLSQIELVTADLSDSTIRSAAMEGVGVVFHLAAMPSVARSVECPEASFEANGTGTLLLLLAARDAGVRRFIYASSAAVYGNPPGGPRPRREDDPVSPESPYAVGKVVGEHFCRVFWRLYGLPTVSLRYFNVFGPRQRADSAYASVVPTFIGELFNGRRPTIHGDGEQFRDFTFVGNVVKANLLALSADKSVGLAVNVACGSRHTINDLYRALHGLIGGPDQPQYGPPRPGDVRGSVPDLTWAREVLGYDPDISFEDGLTETVEWFRMARSNREPTG